MAVDVPREDGGESSRDQPARNDVGMIPKDEIRRSDAGAFHALMKAEQPDIGRLGVVLRVEEKTRESLTNAVAHVWKCGERDAETAHIDDESPRPVDDVYVRMRGEERERDRRALVIARRHDDRDSRIRKRLQRLERANDETRLDAAPIEHISAMDDEIHLPAKRRLERTFVTPKEGLSAAIASAKAEVSVSE
jgi:hypothetical protein